MLGHIQNQVHLKKKVDAKKKKTHRRISFEQVPGPETYYFFFRPYVQYSVGPLGGLHTVRELC